MLGTIIKTKFRPLDYDLFAGLDVDKRHIDVTFSDHDQTTKSMKIPYDADHLLAYIRRHYAGRRVAFVYEAGPTGYGLYDELTAAGHCCLVVAPSMVPTAVGQRVKTNRLDSRKLSQALRGGALKSIHVPTPVYRQLRHLVQLRDTYVRQATAFQARIKAMLLLEGLSFPDPRGQWTVRAVEQLRTLHCEGELRFKLDRLLSSLTFAWEQLRQTTREIRRYCQSQPELAHNLELVMSVPGIGHITGTHFLARVGDWRLLGNLRQLAGFLGLVPSEDSTGDDVNRGSITRIGDRRLCAQLTQAAWRSIRSDTELHDFYVRIYQRNPKPIAPQKAIVAVAHKICTRLGCVLKEQRPYLSREEFLASRKKEETTAPQETTRTSAETSAARLPEGSATKTEIPAPVVNAF